MGDEERRACNYLHHHLLDRIIQRKAKCKGEVLLNGPKIMSPHRQEEQCLRTGVTTHSEGASTFILDFKCRATTRFKLRGGRPMTPLKMIQ
jgi:hypothetical protein